MVNKYNNIGIWRLAWEVRHEAWLALLSCRVVAVVDDDDDTTLVVLQQAAIQALSDDNADDVVAVSQRSD